MSNYKNNLRNQSKFAPRSQPARSITRKKVNNTSTHEQQSCNVKSKQALYRKQNGKKRRARVRNQRKARVFGSVDVLTAIENQPIQTRCIRYKSVTVTAEVAFLGSDLLSMLLWGTDGSTTSYRIFESVKLRHVAVTLLPNSETGAGQFVFSWSGNTSPNFEDVLLYAQGISFRKVYVPPEDSLASFWITPETPELTEPYFTLQSTALNAEVILDIAFEYVLASAPAISVTTNDPTVTGIVCPVLPASGDDFSAVGLPTVFF